MTSDQNSSRQYSHTLALSGVLFFNYSQILLNRVHRFFVFASYPHIHSNSVKLTKLANCNDVSDFQNIIWNMLTVIDVIL